LKPPRKKPQLTNPQSAQELLEFYSDFVGYYRQWALRHRTIYWILVYLSVACGISVAWLLLLKADALYVAEIALVLNCLLIINSAARPDRKYPRYRMVEIRLMFELQKMNHGVARRIKNGEEPESALLAAIEELHPKVESLVLEEFGEFFRDFTSINDFHTQMADAGKRKPSES
jgi:Flp pilus assembly protein TadB